MPEVEHKNVFETMLSKTDLRRALIVKRSAISAELRTQWDASIGAQLIAWWNAHPVQTLGVYWAIRGEPDLRDAYAELTMRGVQLALPVVVGDSAPLEFAAWQPGEDLVKDSFGVAVPAVRRLVWPDAVLAPCVGFNAQRSRLGYGGGFYDRTLARAPRPLAIGIAYACTLTAFDAAAHDIALDEIITNAPT